MKKIAQSFLALAALVVLSTVSRAVWDSTLGNMPNSYELCWGLSSNACLYGSTISNFVKIQIGGVDQVTVTSTNVALAGNLTVSGSETVLGYQDLAVLTTTQLAARTDPVGATFYAQELIGGTAATNAYNLCASTAANPGSYVYIAVSTSAAAVAGKACAN